MLTDAALAAAEAHFNRRADATRRAIEGASDYAAAARALLELAASWTPAPLAGILGDALELAAWEGREDVFRDAEELPVFAIESVRLSFREQIDFLRQKRVKPTKVWTDALHGVHDRAFVIAGATDTAMLEEFQAALVKAAEEGLTVDAFAKDFDRIVAKYGWSYRGERTWRIRAIFETNMRTSFMAGRLKQMRDPDVVRLRPYWQYIHGDSRIPQNPRPVHLSWNGLVLMHDDPWWEVHFPPNDWLCSCGVRTLSKRDLDRLGKSGPDEAPKDPLMPVIDKATGQMVMQRQGVGQGWDYMPGDQWERGLVPSALLNDPKATPVDDRRGQNIVSIDTPEPMADLLARARPFQAQVLPAELPDEDYLRAFLAPFDADIGRAVLWEDMAGARLVISEEMLRAKGRKRGHADHAALLAEALRDPDEIWLGVRAVPDPDHPGYVDYRITRRYIRVDPDTGLFVLFELGRTVWEAITGYASFTRSKPDYRHIDHQRVGKLLWKRK